MATSNKITIYITNSQARTWIRWARWAWANRWATWATATAKRTVWTNTVAITNPPRSPPIGNPKLCLNHLNKLTNCWVHVMIHITVRNWDIVCMRICLTRRTISSHHIQIHWGNHWIISNLKWLWSQIWRGIGKQSVLGTTWILWARALMRKSVSSKCSRKGTLLDI